MSRLVLISATIGAHPLTWLAAARVASPIPAGRCLDDTELLDLNTACVVESEALTSARCNRLLEALPPPGSCFPDVPCQM